MYMCICYTCVYAFKFVNFIFYKLLVALQYTSFESSTYHSFIKDQASYRIIVSNFMSHDLCSIELEVYRNRKTHRLIKLIFFIYKCAGILLTVSGFSVSFCINEEEGYLLPTIAWKKTCRRFDWMLQLSSGWKYMTTETFSRNISMLFSAL